MSQPLHFGTDGIRGPADKFPFTYEALLALGQSFGEWAIGRYGTRTPHFLIGCDTRISCPTIKKSLIQGISAVGGTVTDAGIIPTPAVGQLVQKTAHFNCGIIISASHNPYYDNGIKLFDAQTGKLTDADEQCIMQCFEAFFNQPSTLTLSTTTDAVSWHEASTTYINNVCALFTPEYLKGLTIVLDCANGATFSVAPAIFANLGANVIALNIEPTGTNINDQCGSLHPESLAQMVIKHNADFGFAFDGDGDRVIAVNNQGLIKDGDDLLEILLQHPAYKDTNCLVGTVMTNKGLENLLVSRNQALIRTKVGDKHVAQQLEKENLPLGGEASGHIIIKDYLVTGDGIFVALKTLESIVASGNTLMQTFEKHAQVIINIRVTHKKDLASTSIKPIIDQHEQTLASGRVLVRYSGTENVLRIMTEALQHDHAQTCASSLALHLSNVLNTEA
ncbi:MAG: hypothetical protein WCT20_01870 [Candidatus Babeliales bacterium]